MSVYGNQFDKQGVDSISDRALYDSMNDYLSYIISGCTVAVDANDNKSFIVSSGHFVVKGAHCGVIDQERVTIDDSTFEEGVTYYGYLVWDIDLSRQNDEYHFNQGIFALTIGSADYPELIKEDINNPDLFQTAHYQCPFTKFTYTTTGGLVIVEDLRPTKTREFDLPVSEWVSSGSGTNLVYTITKTMHGIVADRHYFFDLVHKSSYTMAQWLDAQDAYYGFIKYGWMETSDDTVIFKCHVLPPKDFTVVVIGV